MGDIHVFNRRASTESEIKTIDIGKTLFISAKDLSSSLSAKIYENAERKKLVLYIAGSKIKISGYSSFIIIDEETFQMSKTVSVENNDLFIPANVFSWDYLWPCLSLADCRAEARSRSLGQGRGRGRGRCRGTAGPGPGMAAVRDQPAGRQADRL